MSVVGESSANDGEVRAANPETLTDGMPSVMKPPG